MKSFITALFLILLASVLFLSCCIRDRCTSYHYHRTFPAAYHGAAEYAVDRWNLFSGNRVVIEPGGDPDDKSCAFRSIPHDSEEYREEAEDLGHEFWGLHKHCSGSIVIVPDSFYGYCSAHDVECVRSILMHEIGHEFGLEHIDDPTAVMAPATSGAQEYTESDLLECKRVGVCYRSE